MIGIRDTRRTGVEQAVDQCHKAGISVIMVTGDNITTARTIAENCKIINANSESSKNEATIMNGETFSNKLGGLIKFCTGCDSEIDENELEKYKATKLLEERRKKLIEKTEKDKEKEEKNKEEEEEEIELEKQEQQDECPKWKEKKVIEKERNIDLFRQEI